MKISVKAVDTQGTCWKCYKRGCREHFTSLHVDRKLNDKYRYRLSNGSDKLYTLPRSLLFRYDYPLSATVQVTHSRRWGWTVRDIVRCIQDDYARIYAVEDGLSRRPGNMDIYFSTTAKSQIGIWGHHIGDLVIEDVQVNKMGIVTMSIGS